MDPPTGDVIRVVRVRKGYFKAVEFQLRPGETGLSVFAASPELSSERLLQAVRDAGKQGELAVALVPVRVIRELGLVLIHTSGGTPDAEINAFHREVRIKWMVRLWLWFRRRPLHEYFNEEFSARLCASARLED